MPDIWCSLRAWPHRRALSTGIQSFSEGLNRSFRPFVSAFQNTTARATRSRSQFRVNGRPFLLQDVELPHDLHPPHRVRSQCLHAPKAMSLIPRWHLMTDEAKALTKRTAVSALLVLLVLLVFRALVPWVVLAVVAWWLWKAIKR